MKNRNTISQLVAEFISTYFLIFFGCGSMILGQTVDGYPSGFIAVIWGAIVSVMIYTVGHISGAHMNPAVTLSFFALKQIKIKDVIGFIIVQILGALAASFTHKIIFGTSGHTFGATFITVTPMAGLLIEILLTFCLMFVVCGVATDSRAVGELAGIAIGTTVALAAFVGGPLTNASMNPARSLGPALVNGDLQNIWLFIVGPIIGALLGAVTYQFIKIKNY